MKRELKMKLIEVNVFVNESGGEKKKLIRETYKKLNQVYPKLCCNKRSNNV